MPRRAGRACTALRIQLISERARSACPSAFMADRRRTTTGSRPRTSGSRPSGSSRLATDSRGLNSNAGQAAKNIADVERRAPAQPSPRNTFYSQLSYPPSFQVQSPSVS